MDRNLVYYFPLAQSVNDRNPSFLSLSLLNIVSGCIPSDEKEKDLVGYADVEAEYAKTLDNPSFNASSEWSSNDKPAPTYLLGTDLLLAHWFPCRGVTGSEEKGAALTPDTVRTLLHNRGRTDTTLTGCINVLAEYLPMGWRLTSTAARHLSQPQSFHSYPVISVFNAFEIMLINAASYGWDLEKTMEGYFLNEFCQSLSGLSASSSKRRLFVTTRFLVILAPPGWNTLRG